MSNFSYILKPSNKKPGFGAVLIRFRKGSYDFQKKIMEDFQEKKWEQTATKEYRELLKVIDKAETIILELYNSKQYKNSSELKAAFETVWAGKELNPEPSLDIISLYQDFSNQTLNQLNQDTKTKNNYITVLNHLKNFINEKGLINLKSNTYDIFISFQEYFKSLKYNNSTINYYLTNLKTFFTYLYERNLIVDDGFKRIKRFKELNVRKVFFNKADIEKLKALSLKKERDKYRKIILVMIELGCRIGDFKSIKKENITYLKDKDLYVLNILTKKVLTPSIIPFKSDTYNLLDELFIIFNNDFSKINQNHLNEMVKTISREAGINDEILITRLISNQKVTIKREKWELLSIHSTRHTYITNKLNQGFTPSQVAVSTGHTNVQTINRYAQKDVDDFINKFIELNKD